MEYLEQKMDEINAIYEDLNDLVVHTSRLDVACISHFTDPPASLSENEVEQIFWEVGDILKTCSGNIMEALDIFCAATPL